MDYEKEYKKLKAGISKAHLYAQTDSTKAVLETILPELKESEDENIRKELIELISCMHDADPRKKGWIAWLEKQSGKPKEVTCTHEVETGNGNIKALVTEKIQLPKFHEGEWIIRSAENFKHNTYLIKEIKDYYVCEDLKGRRVTFTFNDVHKNFKLWDISDAKDGDVLVYRNIATEIIMLFKSWGVDRVAAYTHFHIFDNNYRVNSSCDCSDGAHPATKEQRDTLMKAMADAGYEFDYDTKELKKIENEIEIPFGAKDCELQEATYYIPKGFHAEIDDDKVVIKKCEKPTAWNEDDDSFVQDLTDYFNIDNELQHTEKDVVSWLNSLKERIKNGN